MKTFLYIDGLPRSLKTQAHTRLQTDMEWIPVRRTSEWPRPSAALASLGTEEHTEVMRSMGNLPGKTR